MEYRLSTDSTMNDARALAASGASHGAMVLAEEQTAGRGRKGRAFHSPAGENIYVTFVLRLDVAGLRAAPLAIPLAVARAIRATGVNARIKWPNDIWVQGDRKVSGMLIDSEVDGGSTIVFPGIGINVNGDPTQIPELADIATSLRLQLGSPVDRESLLAGLCNEMEALLARPVKELAPVYRDLSLVLGRKVTIAEGGNPPYDALAADIAEDGSLVVELADGRRLAVTAAEVSVRPAG